MEFTEYDTRLGAYAVIVDEAGRILLSWYNGYWGGAPGWSLPGGGVEYDETMEEAVIRECLEETGYVVEVSGLLALHTITRPEGTRTGRPYKSLRALFTARVVGGELGTTEVDGTTDFGAWMTIEEALAADVRADIIDIGIAAWQASQTG